MPTKDDVMRAICCPRGCQARGSGCCPTTADESMCHTCRHRHETQAEAVMALYVGFIRDPRLDPARHPDPMVDAAERAALGLP